MCTVLLCPHSYRPGIAEGFGLIKFNIPVHCKSHQFTQRSSHSAVASTWLLVVCRFGVVQAEKEHLNVSFFPLDKRLRLLVRMALD